MSRNHKAENKGKRRAAAAAGVLLAAVFAAGGGIYYIRTEGTSVTDGALTAAYKTSEVKRGTVAVSITESGTITTGTIEQVLSLEVDDSDESSDEGADTDVEVSSDVDVSESEVKTMSSGEAGGVSVDMGSMAGSAGSGSAGSGSSSATAGGSSTSSSSEDTTLTVEEVLVSVGQSVTAGDAILTVTSESVEEYRQTLEAAVVTAQLTVRQEEINVETKKTEADYTYSMYLAQGETAQATYDATIESLQKAVDDAQEAVDDAQDSVDTYQYYVDLGYDYDDELEEALEELEDAEDKLVIAQNNQTTQSIEAKQTLQTSLTNYEYADQLYEIDTNGLEDDLEAAQDELEEAQSALADFNTVMADGTIYAQYSGTITSVSYAEGDTLTDGAAVVAYQNPDDVTMTVSVTQDDISNISIGDEASVLLDAYDGETFAGTVTAIETATSMGSSTVTYSVTVTLNGDVERIYNGMTGEADFSVQSEADVLYIPNKAVRQDGARTYVKVLSGDGTVTQMDVTTGFSNGTNVVVLSGLEEGQTVVIESGLTA